MDELIQAMAIDELEAMKVTYKDNTAIVSILDGYIASKTKEAEQAEAKANFEMAIAKFANGVNKQGKPYLPHPDDVSNVFLHWGEVTIEVGEPEEVTITNEQGELVTELRKPTQVVSQWIVEVNSRTTKLTSGNGGGSGGAKTSKRAINMFKHNPTGADEVLGEYSSYQKFADDKGINVGGDSARRAVERDGYYGVPVDNPS